MWLLRAIKSFRPLYPPSATARDRRAMRPLLRPLAFALALALLLSGGIALAAPGAAYADAGGHRNSHATMDYLALGDSVAFGYSPLVTNPSDPDNFVGYPTPVAQRLGLKLTNAACPGATSSYLISLSGSDYGCKTYPFPLHVSYSTSQLQYAVSFLRSHPRTRLVTIDIGVNDLFKLRDEICGGPIICPQLAQYIPGALAAISANLDTIYGAIRHKAHYHGQLVALTYYSLNYKDTTLTGFAQALDQVIATRTHAWGGAVADGFGAFAEASEAFNGDPCAAGLLIRTSPTGCDIHPSAKGRNLLAAAIVAVVKHNKDRSVAA